MVNFLWVCVKIGDQQNDLKYSHAAMKDGMIIDYIDPNDPNYGEDWFPSSGASKVFLWLRVPYSYKANLDTWLITDGDINDKVNYRVRKQLLQIHLLPQKTQDLIRDKKATGKVIDLTSAQPSVLKPDLSKVNIDNALTKDIENLLKPSTTLNPAALDENLISTGSYNIGSGETYTTVAAFMSDLANLTGDLTGTVTSAITNNSIAQITENLGTYTLTITSDTDHKGDPTSGHLLSWNSTNTGIDFAGTGSAGCKFVLDKLNMKRTGASGNDIVMQSSDSDVEVHFSNLLMDGNNVATRGIWLATNQPTVYVYNCKIWDVVNFGLQFAGSFTGTVENVIVYSCGSHGYYINGIACTLNNCIGYDNAGTEFFGPAGATGNNCAWDGTGNIGFSSETGTVDGLTDGEFTSVDDSSSTFLAISTSSSLYRAGIDGTITGHTTSINGWDWVSGSWDIGPHGVAEPSGSTDTSKLYYGIEIDTGGSDTDTDIGLVSGVIRWITDRPGYDGNPTYPVDENDDNITTEWYEGFLIKNGLGIPNRSLDISIRGDYGAVSGFDFQVRNDGKLWNTLYSNEIFLVNKSVKVYAIIDNKFYNVWAGVITSDPYDDTVLKYNCKSNWKAIHKNIPPNVVSKSAYPNAEGSNQGKPIPICMGDVSYVDVLNVGGENTKIVLSTINSVDSYYCPAASYNTSIGNNIYLKIITKNNQFDADYFIGKYLQIISGSNAPDNRFIKINDSTASQNNNGFKATVLTLEDEIGTDDTTFNADYSYDPYSPGSNGDTWWFNIIDIGNQGIASDGLLESWEQNSVNQYYLYQYDEQNKEFDDLSFLVDSVSTSTGRDVANIFLGNTLNKDNEIEIINPLPIGEYNYSTIPVGTVWPIALSSNVIDRDRTTALSYTFSSPNIFLEYDFRIKTLGIDFSNISDLYLGADIDFTLHGPDNAWIRYAYEIYDVFGYQILDVEDGNTWEYDLGTGTSFDINWIPNNFYRGGGDDNGEVSIWGGIDDSANFYSDYIKLENTGDYIKSGMVGYIKMRILIFDYLQSESVNINTINFKQIGLFGRKTSSIKNKKLYSRVTGEQFGTNSTGNVYNSIRHMVETYDSTPTANITYDNLPTTRNNWPCSRQIVEQKNSFDYIKELCQFSYIGAFQARDGDLKFRAWRAHTTADATHDESAVIRDSLKNWKRTPIESVYNEFTLNYAWNPGSKQYDRALSITNVENGTFPTLDAADTWKTYVEGVNSYADAKIKWDICRDAHDRLNQVIPAPKNISECMWYDDPARFNNTESGGVSVTDGVYYYLSQLVEWATRQKDTVEYALPINSTNITLDLLDNVTFNDAIYTNNTDRTGWITGIRYDLDKGQIWVKLILEPTDISTDNIIIETGDAPDIIIETGTTGTQIIEGA